MFCVYCECQAYEIITLHVYSYKVYCAILPHSFVLRRTRCFKNDIYYLFIVSFERLCNPFTYIRNNELHCNIVWNNTDVYRLNRD